MNKMINAFTAALAGTLLIAGSVVTNPALAADAAELDARAKETLQRLYKFDKGSMGVVESSAGVLVFSSILKGSFLFGAEGGDGALLVKGKPVAYYNTAAASFGVQAGVQEKSLVIIFRDEEGLKKFRATSGWEMGVDAQVAFYKSGSGDTISTAANRNSIIAIVFGNKGFLADVSVKGGKFTKLDM